MAAPVVINGCGFFFPTEAKGSGTKSDQFQELAQDQPGKEFHEDSNSHSLTGF